MRISLLRFFGHYAFTPNTGSGQQTFAATGHESENIMPKLNNATVTAAPRKRTIKQKLSAIILPTHANLVSCGLSFDVPASDDITAYGASYFVASDFSDGGATYYERGAYAPGIVQTVLAAHMPALPEREPVNLTTAITMQHENGDCESLFALNPARTLLSNNTMPMHDNAPAPTGTMLIPYVAPAIADTAPAVSGLSERRLAKLAAAKAVSEFYPGPSLPFKAAVDLRYRAPINFARFAPGSINGTERTASALAAILAYCDVQPNGTFVRGSGAVPRTMLGLPHDPANPTLAAGIESGVLSRLIGTGAVSYVSGETSGTGCELATYRINVAKARANMLWHNSKQANGEHRYSRVLALLDAVQPTV